MCLIIIQVLPGIGAVSILELAANSGSSRMFRAPNLQRATMLFIICFRSEPTIYGSEQKLLEP